MAQSGQPQYQPPPPPQGGQPYGQQPSGGRYPYGEKNKTTYAILAILLGWLGIHHFYVGNTGYGIIHIVLACVGISGILGLISGILALMKSDEEFYQEYICQQKFI